MKPGQHNLLVTAHPDDETIFFAGLLLTNRERPWTLVCVTDGNADGQGADRANQLLKASKKLGVKTLQQWDLPDKFECRLDQKTLEEKLSNLPLPNQVFTHGILGEYGHPHHQDVSFAVHRTFSEKVPTWSIAYNIRAEKNIELSPQFFNQKSQIMVNIYQNETFRFLNVLPISSHEGFSKVNFAEVDHIYQFLNGHEALHENKLDHHRHLYQYLIHQREILPTRPF